MTPNSLTAINRGEVYTQLRNTFDPVHMINVVEMGLIAKVTIVDEHVAVELYQPYPDTRSLAALQQSVAAAMLRVNGCTTSTASLVVSPLWDTTMMSPSVRISLGLERPQQRH